MFTDVIKFNFTGGTKFDVEFISNIVIKFTFTIGKWIGQHINLVCDGDSGCAYVDMRGGGRRISLSREQRGRRRLGHGSDFGEGSRVPVK